LATKKEVIKYITKNFSCEQMEDSFYKLVFDIDGDRSQLVFALVTDSALVVGSPFALTKELTAKQALDACQEYDLGIGIVGDYYMLKHLMPIDDLDESEIMLGFQLVAVFADELEEKLVGGDRL